MEMGQPADTVFFIGDGMVKIFTEDQRGRRFTTDILGRGENFGALQVVCQGAYTHHAIAIDKSILLCIESAGFLRLLRSTPEFTIKLMSHLAYRLQVNAARMQDITVLSVYGRVARQILILAERYDDSAEIQSVEIPLRLTQIDIADMIGASRVQVNKALNYFRRKKYISFNGHHHITILNREGLQKCCY
jgi:CRP-like cAMP-binding protein